MAEHDDALESQVVTDVEKEVHASLDAGDQLVESVQDGPVEEADTVQEDDEQAAL